MEQVHATQLLRDDHKKIKGLFRQLQASDFRAPEMKQGVAQEVFMELEIHSRLEEDIFYTAFEEVTDASGRALISESRADHQEVSEIIQQLRGMNANDEDFDSRFEDLMDAVEGHVDEEEHVLFPMAETLLANRLDDLGRRMQQLRQQLLTQPEYKLSQPEHVQDPNGGEQMRKQGENVRRKNGAAA